MTSVLTFLEQNRSRLKLDTYGLAGNLSGVTLTPRFRASSHVVTLVTTAGATEPKLVTKMPRLLNDIHAIEREARSLEAVQALRPQGFASIPRLLTFERFAGYPILVETALVGEALDPKSVRSNPVHWCQTALEWLRELRVFGTWSNAEWYEQQIVKPLERFAQLFPLNADEHHLVQQTRKITEPLRTEPVPLVFEHGDFSHPNVLRLRTGGLGVVDWELGDPKGLPLADLFCFLSYVAFACAQARTTADYVQAFEHAFLMEDAWARWFAVQYARDLGVPEQALSALFVACWTRYMLQLLGRLGSTIDQDTATWLRQNRFFAIWRLAVANVDSLNWNKVSLRTPNRRPLNANFVSD